MDINALCSSVYHFFLVHQWGGLGVVAVCVILLWKRPWLFLKGVCVLLAVTVVIYIFSMLNQSAFTGAERKKSITTEREDNLFRE